MNNNKSSVEGRGMGVGYVTLIMLFAVICLTVLASLSYQAASANDKLNEKSIAFTDGYYAADSRAKERLAKLDEAAKLSFDSGFFEDSFAAFCEEDDEIRLRRIAEGFEISFEEAVSENLGLSVKIVFFSVPSDGVRYSVEEWKTVSLSDTQEENTLGVWDGGNLA